MSVLGWRNLDLRAWVRGWPHWVPVAVAVVLAGYAVAGVVGLLGGPYVFAPAANPDNLFHDHWLSGLAPPVVLRFMLVLALVGFVAVLLQRRDVRWLRSALIVVSGMVAAFTSLVLPGPLALDAIPVLNLLNLKRLDWPTVHLVLLTYTGLALAASTLAYARRTRGACVHCGRRPGFDGRSRRQWARVGLAASVAAFVTPLGYAVVRVCWAAGIPVGTTQEFLAQINSANPGHVTVILELTMAGMATGGGLLCLGLTRPWSEVWPRWVPSAAGRPVPHWLPIVLGTICGVGLTGNATMLLPGLVRAASGTAMYYPDTAVPMAWVSHLPAVSLLLWGPLVLFSVLAFHYRTRGRCQVCHQR